MRKIIFPSGTYLRLVIVFILMSAVTHAQQLNIRDFVLFGGSGNCPVPNPVNPNFPGCGVQIGTSGTVNGGKIGSYKLVRTTGNAVINADLHSAGEIVLSNSNTINGNIYAGDQAATSNLILQAGSNFSVNNVFVNGSSSVSGGVINGFLIHPSGTTYTGPVPAGSEIIGNPTIPVMPNLPGVTNFPAAGTTNVTNTQTVQPFPVVYDALTLNGGKTVTFSGTGDYVFSRIKNTGNNNKFVFDFQNNPNGYIRVFVHGDVDLYKINAEIINGGSASRILMEVHGTGSTQGGNYSWMLTNGASGNNQSVWYGTVWAPYGGINVGSGSSPSKVNGALWSGTQVVLDNGVSITHVMFEGCNIPNVNAGADKAIDCDHPTTILNGSSATANVQYSWSVINGNFSSTLQQPTVSAGGSYVLTVTEPSCGMSATDTVVVVFTPCILPYYPPSNTGKVLTKIGSELTSLYTNYGNVADSAKTIFLLQSDSVLIDIIAMSQVSQLKSLLMTSYGLRDTIPNGPNSLIITGWFPIVNLPVLNTLSLVNYCRPAFPAISNSGIAMTAGDSAMRTNFVRNGYGLSGDSIKVGVLSDSYNTLTGTAAGIDVSNGDLPGIGNPVNNNPVQVVKEYPYGRRSDEGRAMLQIIHDVAPKAKLAFRTGFLTPGDFALGIRELADSGCHVITDDITFITEPFFRQGVVESSIQAVTANGVSYVTAAGNFGVKSYESIFQPAAGNPPSGLVGKAHDFGGGDIFQNDSIKGSILQPGIYTIVLQWEDDIYSLGNNTGTVNDLDIYLTDNNGVTLFGFNRNNIGGDPIEVLPFTVTANTATNILVVNASASSTATTSNLRFKYVVFRGELKINEYNQGNSTIVGQGNAVNAITVGAALYSNTPAYGVSSPTVASFSSRGGTPVNNVIRNKPDFVAPNGVNTTVNFGSIDYENDGLPNFFGTSAAAPHVAGAIALMMEAKKRFYNQSLSPADVKNILAAGALDMYTPGFDFNSGFGLVNVDSSMRSLANPTPQVIRIELADSSLTPGAQPMDLLIHGNYFTSGSVVLFGADTLTTTVQSNSLAITTIPAFTEEKLVSVYTEPMSLSGDDGGMSNSISITGVPKKIITIIADNKTKKYGQVMPAFTATILVDGDSIQNTSFTPLSLGLNNITYTTPATAMSDVGLYVIHPVRTFDSSATVDANLLALYHYVFTDGILSVQQLPVTVKPRDTTLVYGQQVGNIHFDYSFDPAITIDNPANLLNVISSSHQSMMANNVIGLINGKAVAIVNGQAIPIINGQAVTIINGKAVTIINGQAVPIVNGQAITIVNGTAVPIVNTLADSVTENLAFLVSEESVENARQITNEVLVNGSLVTQTTNVIDVTQESILDFDVDPVQTELLTSVSETHTRGIVSASALMNGVAVTIVNGQAIPIINGQAVTIINGVAVTIVNGQAIPIVNSLTNSSNKTAVVIDEADTLTGVNNLRSLNMITGLTSGLQNIIPAALLNDNLDIRYEVGDLHILPAPLTVKAKDSSKMYGQSIQLDSTRFLITSGSMQFNDSIDHVMLQSNGTSAGASAGNYPIVPSNAVGYGETEMSNYSITYVNGNLAVGKLLVTVQALDTSRTYGSSNPVFKASYSGFASGETLATSGITGSPSLTTSATVGSVVGTYPITASLGSLGSSNYNFSFVNGVLTVNKAPLTVKADDKVIFQGDQLPNFTGTITGLKNGDAASYSYNVTGYTGSAGLYPIVPVQGTFAKVNNYQVTLINGTLYVNPKGNGAKKLRPYLDCVEEVLNPSSPSRRYVAHFFCENTNATPVYVPVGVDNKINSTGSFDASQQPVLFMPGTTRFDVPFDGTQLIWELKTYETNKKTSVASTASSGSNKCNGTYTTLARGVALPAPAAVENSNEINVYPNPVKNKVLVKSKNGSMNERSILLLDAIGKFYPVRISGRVSGQSVELDLTGLQPGIYFIRVMVSGELKTMRVIKN